MCYFLLNQNKPLPDCSKLRHICYDPRISDCKRQYDWGHVLYKSYSIALNTRGVKPSGWQDLCLFLFIMASHNVCSLEYNSIKSSKPHRILTAAKVNIIALQNTFSFTQRTKKIPYLWKPKYEGRSERKERCAIQRHLLIIGKKQNMQVLSHTFTYFST